MESQVASSPQPQSLNEHPISHAHSLPDPSRPESPPSFSLYQEVKLPDCAYRHYILASRLNPDTQIREHQTICQKFSKEDGEWVPEAALVSSGDTNDGRKKVCPRLVCSLRAQAAFRRKRARDEVEKKKRVLEEEKKKRILEERNRKCEECEWETLEVCDISGMLTVKWKDWLIA